MLKEEVFLILVTKAALQLITAEQPFDVLTVDGAVCKAAESSPCPCHEDR